MPRYDVFLEGRTESSTCYFGVAVMADDQKEAEFLGHEAGRVKHQEYDEIEVVGQYRQYPDAPIATRRGCENNTEVNDYEEKKMPHDGWRVRPA